MKVVTSEFIGNENSVEALTAKNDVLARTVASLTYRLSAQQQMLRESAAAYGEADARTQKWQQAVNNTTAELNKAKAQIAENTDAITQLGEAEDSTSGITSAFQGALDELGISMGQLTVAGVVGLVITAIESLVSIMGDAITSAAAYADNLLTLSTSYGIATDKLQELSYMAELTDTSLDTITGSISKLTKSMDAARNGNEDVAQAFAKLNISVTDSTGNLRDAYEVFEKAIGGLSMIADGTERDTIAMKLFGKGVQELNPLISAFTNGSYKELVNESHELGYVLTDEELAALGAVDDGFQRLDKVMEMVKNRVALEMAPELVNLAEQLIEVATTVDWQQFGHDVASIIHATTPLIVDLATALAGLSEALVKLIDAVSSLPWGKNPTNWGAAQNIVSRQASRFPGLAEGGVVEPNNPALYILGDNTREREIVAPESLMRQIARESGGGRVEVVVRNPSTTDNQIVRALTPEIDVRTAQRGLVL